MTLICVKGVRGAVGATLSTISKGYYDSQIIVITLFYMSLPFKVHHSFQMKYSTVSWYLAREGRALNCTVGKAVLQMPFPPSPKFNTRI